jgi:hypothetical protein
MDRPSRIPPSVCPETNASVIFTLQARPDSFVGRRQAFAFAAS